MFTLSLTKVQTVSQRVLAVLVAFVVACGLAAVAAPRASAARATSCVRTQPVLVRGMPWAGGSSAATCGPRP